MIKISNLYKSFHSKPVLSGLSLEIHDGKSTVVIGKSGSGKTVLLKLIIGLLRPDVGEIWIDDQNILNLNFRNLQSIRGHFGYVFQAAALFDSMTVAENVGLGLKKSFNWSDQQIHNRVKKCLSFVDLSNVENKFPAELSGGMKKRVGIARAIAASPRYILFDEPTTGLDPETAENINQLIVKLKRELKLTSIIVTHDMHSAFSVGDSIALLHNGVIELQGTPETIRGMHHHEIQKFLIGCFRVEKIEALDEK